MGRYAPLSKSEIDDLENEGRLWICPSCDAHCDADEAGEGCPKCGEPADDGEAA